ncbi:polysaccharide deacetylase, putative [Babesia ovata]|uniref:Polysaccharide deacetylase, putative n=1 Tax=Babesia ovata TaxID=189622 RepID=A0A2H6K6Y1_9APIC|nr:polysaccharide deacetylase, putative [Babesia ovata]GBE58753.1 polysaccharide deacetylase, putative [Babesia ovata]
MGGSTSWVCLECKTPSQRCTLATAPSHSTLLASERRSPESASPWRDTPQMSEAPNGMDQEHMCRYDDMFLNDSNNSDEASRHDEMSVARTPIGALQSLSSSDARSMGGESSSGTKGSATTLIPAKSTIH